MRKLISATAVLLLSMSVSAQYKKAGFFEKQGRTYELGSQVYVMGKNQGHPIGYKFSFGRDQDGKRLFATSDFHFIPSYAYSYNTTDDANNPITVMGHSKFTVLYGINYNFHLLSNDGDEKPMVQPFIGIGLNTVLTGGMKDESYSGTTIGYPKRQTSEATWSLGLQGGPGVIVNLSPKLGIKIQGGYSHQFNISGSNWEDEVKPFYVFDSHAFGTVSLRLRIAEE